MLDETLLVQVPLGTLVNVECISVQVAANVLSSVLRAQTRDKRFCVHPQRFVIRKNTYA